MSFWEGKVAIVTGGASGIGRASALLFVERGARVVVADVNETGGQETVKLAGGPEHAIFVRADTTSEADVKRLVDTAVATFGGVHVLHNNAAILRHYERIEDIPLESFRRVVDVNLTGIFITARAVVPVMRRQGGGVIVNMSSMGAKGNSPLNFAYASSKAGILAFTRGLAMQLKPANIRVNAILPGGVDTPMMRGGRQDQGQWDQAQKQAAQRRLGLVTGATQAPAPLLPPAEMARAIAYAAEHEELTGAYLQYTLTPQGRRFSLLKDYQEEELPLPP